MGPSHKKNKLIDIMNPENQQHNTTSNLNLILFLLSSAVFLSPLNHDLKRYGLPSSLISNDNGWLFLIPIIFSFLSFSFLKKWQLNKNFTQAFFVALATFVHILLTGVDHVHSFIPVFRFIIFILLPLASLIIVKKKALLFILVLLGVLTLHSQWAVTQLIFQRDLGMNIIGEPHLLSTTPGVAKFLVFDKKIIRSYGPYQHANNLAGTLALASATSITLMAFSKNKKNRTFLCILFFCLALGVFASFSRSGLVALFIPFICLQLFPQKKLLSKNTLRFCSAMIFLLLLAFSPLLLFRNTDPQDKAFADRGRGYGWAMSIIQTLPAWRGVGIGNYSSHLLSYLQQQHIAFQSWEIAPVHNSFLLLAVEFGLIPSLVLGAVLYWSLFRPHDNNHVLHINYIFMVSLLPILLLDHYALTSTTTLVVTELLWLALGLHLTSQQASFATERISQFH